MDVAGLSRGEAALSFLPGCFCRCFEEDALSEKANGMASCLLPLASVWAGLASEAPYVQRKNEPSAFPRKPVVFC